MRTVLMYMLSLAFLLLGGYHYVEGTPLHRKHLSKFVISAEKAKFAKLEQHSSAINQSVSGDDKQSIFNVEDEDEDPIFGRKLVQLTGCFVTLFYGAFLFYSLKTLKKRLLYVTRLNFVKPQRYILQGALLI